jgi:Xaa-Pro aminopeptidase
MLIREKVRQAQALLNEAGIDCWLTFTRESEINGDPALPFLNDADVTWHSAFIICADGRAKAVVGQYDRQTVLDTGAYDEVIGFVTGIREPLQQVMRRLDPKRIAVNYSEDSEICDGLTHGMYLTLHGLLAGIGMAERLVSAEAIVSALRERKTEGELARIRAAVLQASEILQAAGSFIRPGVSESEIAAWMQNKVRERGLELAWARRTCPSVFTGPDTAGAHYAPGSRRVEAGHLVNIDFGVRVEDYCSDLQRTYYVLGPGERTAPDEVARGLATITSSIARAQEAIKPGVQGQAVDAIARAIVTAAGYEPFPHGLGHQVGRFAHDGTALLGPAWEKYAGKPFRPLASGMVFTIEPRLTVPGHGIVTIEEMVQVTADGCEWLSTPQQELILIPGEAGKPLKKKSISRKGK